MGNWPAFTECENAAEVERMKNLRATTNTIPRISKTADLDATICEPLTSIKDFSG